MQGVGAYFGSTRINQGAAGLGQDGQLIAFADGVIGGSPDDAETPGPLQAYHDCSLGLRGLGDDPGQLMAFSDGIMGGSPNDAETPGPLQAYHDGSLGLGDDAPHPNTYSGDTPISVFHDGIFNEYRSPSSNGPLMAYHDGSLGADAAPAGATLDLGDTATLAEVKSLIALMSGGWALSADGQKTYTPDFYTSGIWEPSASQLWQYVVSSSKDAAGKQVSASAGDQTYPNGTGIGLMIGILTAPVQGAPGPDYVKANFPTLYAWGLAGGGPVLPPYLSLADKTRGDRAGASGPVMSNMAMYGLGAAVVLGIALILRRRK